MSAAPFAIRPEGGGDAGAIWRVVASAFGRTMEADLVEALRGVGMLFPSLVAIAGGEVVGHVGFSAVRVGGRTVPVLGLAPLAVEPAHQGRGVGRALVQAGLEASREAGAAAVGLVGDPAYHGRLGFAAAGKLGLSCEFEVTEDVFMACVLDQGGMQGIAGVVRFRPEFGAVTD